MSKAPPQSSCSSCGVSDCQWIRMDPDTSGSRIRGPRLIAWAGGCFLLPPICALTASSLFDSHPAAPVLGGVAFLLSAGGMSLLARIRLSPPSRKPS